MPLPSDAGAELSPALAASNPPAVGGAAILARLRAQRQQASTAAAAPAAAPAAAAAETAPKAAAAPAAAGAPAAAAPAATATPPPAAAAPAPTTAAPAAASPASPGPQPAARAPAPAPAAAAAAGGPPVATGGAAILARLRAQRAAKASAGSQAAPSKQVLVLYASQTGTAQEIAKNIQAEAEQRGIKGRVASMNEFGFDNLRAEQAPVVVFVASSTGDGDSPDNAAKFYATLRRKSQPEGLLDGIQFTGFGLGDSNYTRYQYVPRAIKQRFLALSAQQFYDCGEADEVDGIETNLDKWLEGLWPALRKAVLPEGAAAAAEAAPAAANGTAASSGGAGAEGELKGVPPLPACRVQLVWQKDVAAAAVVQEGEAAAPSQAELARRDESGEYSAEAPFWAPVTAARYLTTPLSDPDRQVLHLELDIGGSGMRYAPGDSIGVLPQNNPALVAALLDRLGLDGDSVFDVAPAGAADLAAAPAPAAANGAAANGTAQQPHLLPHLHAPCSVRAALAGGVDLTGPPRKSLLRLLAEHCAESAERHRLLHLCSRDGREDYAAEMLAGRPSLLDLLKQFPSCKPPLDALLDALPPLAARMYSLSCSPLESPDKVQVAFTVVRYNTPQYGEHAGVATNWLHSLCQPQLSASSPPTTTSPAADGTAGSNGCATLRLPIFLRRGGAFGPPESLDTPIIMIGPGTGVTPFRGFLQHRRAQIKAAAAAAGAAQEGGGSDGGSGGVAKGEAWLYFGCRREDQDYLYRQDLEAFVADGTLDRLHLAFSRAQQHKVYVQHLMAQHAAELYNLIAKRGARVFLCGDGASMAKDVHSCLVSIISQQGGLTEAQAAEQLAEMTRQGRYVRDIWS